MISIIFLGFFLGTVVGQKMSDVTSNDVAVMELKCLVCEVMIKESLKEIAKADPRKTVPVGSYRIEVDGSQKQKQIKYAGSEDHIDDVMEKICATLEDYAQAAHKDTKELALLKLTESVDMLSIYEPIQDADLNAKLKTHCENIIGEHDEDFIRVFSKNKIRNEAQAIKKLCYEQTDICGDGSTAHLDKAEL